ncbi:J domain-containing protein [Pararhizobium mangrovi]|uniref:DnaJ family molecular chaperone n=1 Tax=Pararhizobium mangrovi TaxID=2590452 RepID=A0A506U8I9_9HYPH|nr:DnaJ family molecular chaperone [Pararhizobium mangrovi]TPW29285.1 DnaJ family molecular chaperone [Pararhizobium mangrovi]
MANWARVFDHVGETASEVLASVIEAVRTLFAGDPQTRRKVAFSIAMIALSAKMAKADGIVTEEEVAAFQQIFAIPPGEERNVARFYNLAKRDVAGYQAYAERIAGMCSDEAFEEAVLEDILEGLFHIAKADGVLHDKESAFLADIARIFGIGEDRYAAIFERHVRGDDADPYRVLGVAHDADLSIIKKRYRKLVADNHPDRLIARGVPQEFVAVANERTATFNAAFEAIERERQAA